MEQNVHVLHVTFLIDSINKIMAIDLKMNV